MTRPTTWATRPDRRGFTPLECLFYGIGTFAVFFLMGAAHGGWG